MSEYDLQSIDQKSDDVIPIARPRGLVLILDTPKGRGLFANEDVPARTVLDIAPVLVLDPVENEMHVRKTELYNYTYNWPYRSANGDSSEGPTQTQAVVFGLGSLFNHSRLRQNVGWTRDVPKKLVIYTTLRDVKKGEELCINYGDRLTFVDADAGVESEEEEDGGLSTINLI